MSKVNFEPGAPMEDGGIPLCVPEIRGNEWAFVKECLDTNFVSSLGPFVDRFESEMAAYTGTKMVWQIQQARWLYILLCWSPALNLTMKYWFQL